MNTRKNNIVFQSDKEWKIPTILGLSKADLQGPTTKRIEDYQLQRGYPKTPEEMTCDGVRFSMDAV